MTQEKYGWTEEERRLVVKLSKKHSDSEIVYKLVQKGYKKRSRAAVNGIVRRHKDRLNSPSLAVPNVGPIDVESKVLEVDRGKVNILFFDIETTDLSASFGELMCFGFWWHDEPEPEVLKMWDYEGWDELPVEKRDLYVMQDVVKVMEKADVLVGHFSTGFDFPFIQTRCLNHGMKPIPVPIHIDTWRVAKRQLRLNNNKLKTLAKSLECDEQKDEVPIHVWRRAKAHDVPAMEEIAAYNIQDVRTQRSVTEKLMPIVKNMPNWNLLIDGTRARCPSCGCCEFERKGYAYTKLYKYARLRCKSCGKWVRERKTITPKETHRVCH